MVGKAVRPEFPLSGGIVPSERGIPWWRRLRLGHARDDAVDEPVVARLRGAEPAARREVSTDVPDRMRRVASEALLPAGALSLCLRRLDREIGHRTPALPEYPSRP